MTTEELKAAARAAQERYEQTIERALEERDAEFRRLHEQGLLQRDIADAAGIRSRETVRLALKPEARAAQRKAARDRRARSKADPLPQAESE